MSQICKNSNGMTGNYAVMANQNHEVLRSLQISTFILWLTMVTQFPAIHLDLLEI